MMEFKTISENEFEEYSINHPNANFWQSVNMAHLRECNGWQSEYVAVFEEDEILCAAMLSFREVFLGLTYVQALRGFLIDYHNFALLDYFHDQLLVYLKKHRCMYFKMDPYLSRLQRDMNGAVVENGFNNEDIVEHLKQLGYHHSGYLRGNDNSREPNWMFVLDLKGKDEDTLLKEFDHQTRWSINKTRKMGIKIKEFTKEDLPAFKEIMEHTAARRDFSDHSYHYYEGLFHCFQEEGKMLALHAQLDLDDYEQILNKDEAQAKAQLQETEEKLAEIANSKKFNKRKKVILEELALIEKKREGAKKLRAEEGDVVTLATATFILHGKEILYLYSGAYDKHLKFNAPYAIQWYIIRYALVHGYERYNFYGISGIFEKSAEDYGVYEFKKGFTGNVVELVGDFYYYVRPLSYHLYTSLQNVWHKVKKG